MTILCTRTRFELLTGRPYVGGWKCESGERCVCWTLLVMYRKSLYVYLLRWSIMWHSQYVDSLTMQSHVHQYKMFTIKCNVPKSRNKARYLFGVRTVHLLCSEFVDWCWVIFLIFILITKFKFTYLNQFWLYAVFTSCQNDSHTWRLAMLHVRARFRPSVCTSVLCSWSYIHLLLRVWNMRPEDGCFVQSK